MADAARCTHGRLRGWAWQGIAAFVQASSAGIVTSRGGTIPPQDQPGCTQDGLGGVHRCLACTGSVFAGPQSTHRGLHTVAR